MKKFIKAAAGITLALATVTSVACSTPSDSAEEHHTVQIYMLDAGYGTAFMYKMIEKFKVVEPDIPVEIIEENQGATNKMAQEILDDTSEVDLWFCGEIEDLPRLADAGGYIEDITDVVQSKAYGDTVTIGEKLTDRAKFYSTHDDKYYTLPWASGPGGLVYNADFITEEPKTSKQLETLTESLYQQSLTDENKTPFIWSGGNAGAYWQYIIDIWLAQYMGASRYDEYVTLYKNGEYTYEPLGDPAFEAVYSQVEFFANQKYSVFGSAGAEHTTQQQAFLRGTGAMMPNGDWIENEMKKNDSAQYKYNIKMMKTPVVSALGKKLELGGAGASADMHETALQNVVAAVDEGKTDSEIAALTGISESKIKTVREARSIMYDVGETHRIYMPAYSDAKAEAKKFLRFIYSDEGVEIFRSSTGSSLPVKTPMEASSDDTVFRTSLKRVINGAEAIAPCPLKSKIRYCNMRDLKIVNDIFVSLYHKQATVADLINYSNIQRRWNTFKTQAGL